MRLHVRAEGYVARRLPDVEVQPGEEYDYGSIGLDPGTRVTVRVTDPAGDPVAKARVDLRPVPEHAGGLGSSGRRMRLTAQGKGVYEHDAVPRAWWRLRVQRPGFRVHSQVVEIREQAEQTLKVSLQPQKGAGPDG